MRRRGQGRAYNGGVELRGAITRLELMGLVLLCVGMGWWAMALFGGAGSSSAARNRQRREDIRSLEVALALYAVEHEGRYPEGIGETAQTICRGDAVSCDGMTDLRALIPRYIERIPADPFADGLNATFYMVRREGRRIILAAPSAEGGEMIQSGAAAEI